MAESSFNAFKMAQQQFDEIAEQLNLEQGTRELLRNPLREYHFSIPVKMDHNMTRTFRGMRIQYNDACGPSIGGIRFQPQESVDTIRALAAWTTWTCALLDLPLGGAAGAVVCDPHKLSLREQEQICRGWVRKLARNLGPLRDMPSPDLMTNSQHTLWMLDEYEALHGAKYSVCNTSRPVGMGGGRENKDTVGYGVLVMLRESLKERGSAPNTTTASIQGFGAVAQSVAESYLQLGGKVTTVACWDHKALTAYSLRKQEGVNFQELQKITDQFGSINTARAEEFGYDVLSGDAWLEQEVDILIPAALENQISVDNVGRISEQVKLIAEGAYGPTTPEADRELAQRHIVVIPDILCSAGGVISGYFDQVSSNRSCYGKSDEILAKLEGRMTAIFAAASEFARKKALSLRQAAYVMAIDQVTRACKVRGWV